MELRKFTVYYLERSQLGLKMWIKLIYYKLESLLLIQEYTCSQDVCSNAG